MSWKEITNELYNIELIRKREEEKIAEKLWSEAEEILKQLAVAENTLISRETQIEGKQKNNNKELYEWLYDYAINKLIIAIKYLRSENDDENKNNMLLQSIAQRAIDLLLKKGNYFGAAYAAKLSGYKEYAKDIAAEGFNIYFSLREYRNALETAEFFELGEEYIKKSVKGLLERYLEEGSVSLAQNLVENYKNLIEKDFITSTIKKCAKFHIEAGNYKTVFEILNAGFLDFFDSQKIAKKFYRFLYERFKKSKKDEEKLYYSILALEIAKKYILPKECFKASKGFIKVFSKFIYEYLKKTPKICFEKGLEAFSCEEEIKNNFNKIIKSLSELTGIEKKQIEKWIKKELFKKNLKEHITKLSKII